MKLYVDLSDQRKGTSKGEEKVEQTGGVNIANVHNVTKMSV